VIRRNPSISKNVVRDGRFMTTTSKTTTKYTSFSTIRNFSAVAQEDAAVETVPVTYIYPDGEKREVDAEIGKHLLDVAHDNDIDLEGACGGELACATCHCIFEQSVYDSLPEKLEEEEDMLDLAIDLRETSRLGCQIRVTKELAGIQIQLPNDDA
jgi:ferredoxin